MKQLYGQMAKREEFFSPVLRYNLVLYKHGLSGWKILKQFEMNFPTNLVEQEFRNVMIPSYLVTGDKV